MKNKTIYHSGYFSIITVLISMLSTLLIVNCTTPSLQVSEFEFRYNNQNYIVRSAYCPNNPNSCNHLIGEEFIAVDMNQDRIIDKIDKGDISIGEAQEIYDYSLDLLASQNKLNEINKMDDKYTINNRSYKFEIKSFFPEFGEPFNEFIVTDKTDEWNFKVSVILDEKADGKLDQILKGKMSIEQAQKHYDYALSEGLEDNRLKEINGSIVTK